MRCFDDLEASLSLRFSSLSTTSAAVCRRDPLFPKVRPRRPLISDGSWILEIFSSSRVSICNSRSISLSIRSRTPSEASLKRLLKSKSFSCSLSAWLFLIASLSVDLTRSAWLIALLDSTARATSSSRRSFFGWIARFPGIGLGCWIFRRASSWPVTSSNS